MSDIYSKRSEKGFTYVKKGCNLGLIFEKFVSDLGKDKSMTKELILTLKGLKRA